MDKTGLLKSSGSDIIEAPQRTESGTASSIQSSQASSNVSNKPRNFDSHMFESSFVGRLQFRYYVILKRLLKSSANYSHLTKITVLSSYSKLSIFRQGRVNFDGAKYGEIRINHVQFPVGTIYEALRDPESTLHRAFELGVVPAYWEIIVYEARQCYQEMSVLRAEAEAWKTENLQRKKTPPEEPYRYISYSTGLDGASRSSHSAGSEFSEC